MEKQKITLQKVLKFISYEIKDVIKGIMIGILLGIAYNAFWGFFL